MASVSSDYNQAAANARTDLSDQYKAQQAEKQKLADQHDQEMNRLKQNYEAEKATLTDRFESSTQEEKLGHYENLRNIKRQITQEEQRLNNVRHEVVQNKATELQREQIAAETDGRAKIDDTKRKYAAAENFEHARELAAQDEVRTQHHKSAEAILKDSSQKIAALQEAKTLEVENDKTAHGKAIEEIKGHYDNLRTSTEQQYFNEVKNVQTKTQADLAQRRLSNSQWLSKYSERQEDPFYQLTRFDSQIQDAGDSFILRVKVPDYERDKFHVQVSGQEIQIRGTRSNNEKAEIEHGRWVSTASYQDVAEKFALPVPVDSRTLTKREDGEYLEFTIQKFGPEHRVGDKNFAATGLRDDHELSKALDFPTSLPRPTPIANNKA